VKTANDVYSLIENASTFAVITPGEYYLDKPFPIPQKASSAGIFRLICTGSTFRLSSAFASSPVPLYIEGGTFYASNLDFFASSPTPSSKSVTFQGSLLVGSSVFSDASLNGVFWSAQSL
jgi:hypothetical protein